MPDKLDHGRRFFLGRAAMTFAAARFGAAGIAEARQRVPHQLAALARATGWLNSTPVAATSLSGRVVLIHFGTYSCINWLRTLPYVRGWAQQYRQRLRVIGVHTPEFGFEKNIDNVGRAVEALNLDYPVAIDNDYAIWRAFDNQYWPAMYFLDARGRVRGKRFGEGAYDRSELTIRQLLTETNGPLDVQGAVRVTASGFELAADWRNLKSPELYLGHDRTENFSSSGGIAAGRSHVYTAPTRLMLNHWALVGDWTMSNQPVSLNSGSARFVGRFQARDAHMVRGPARVDKPIRFRVTLDGQRPGSSHGVD